MPNLDGDGNAKPESTTTTTNNSGNGNLTINSSKKKQGYGTIVPQYIVIHNTAGGTASSNADWFCSGAGGSGNCTQFITDDKEIYQIMAPVDKARHIQGSNTSGGKGCASWANTLAPALQQCGATNSNSIGIEVADGYNPNTNTYNNDTVDMAKAVEMTIELTRHLMTLYNIPIENVVRHGDTHNKPCPNRIMELGLWPYFKEQCKKRNEEKRPVSFNPATLNTSGQPAGGGSPYAITQLSTGGGGTGTELYASPTDIEVQLPDVDHRENTYNMDEVKGVSVIFYPPYHSCEAYEANEHFKLFNWDRDYHFTIGKIDPNAPEEEEEELDPEEGLNPDLPTEEEDTDGVSLFNTRASNYNSYIYSVDDGLCVLVQNNGVNTLIDCGEIGKAKKYGVLDHIKELGITKLDNVIITHFHSDHVAGFKDFADSFEIGNVCYKPLDKSKLNENEIGWKTDKYYDEVVSICRDKQIDETKITKDTTVDCINIFAGDTSDNYDNYNRQSLSMIVTMNNKKLFIAGDIIEDTEKLILSKLSKCDSMIIAHHGYAGSNCQELLDKVKADNYFITTYKTDDEDHQEVISRVNAMNTNFYSTNANGSKIALTFNSDKIVHDAKNKIGGTAEAIEGEGDPVGGSKDLEAAVGFKITASTEEARQSKGFTDNDIHTYIDRALFKNKREKHNLTVALMCPKEPDDYPAYEKALIEGLSIILHEHGLGIKDLWREFDLNRAPSPFLYLDRDAWKDLLVEVEKQLNWRIMKYGAYEKQYNPYTAGSSGLSGGNTGSIGAGSPGTPGAPGAGTTPITGDTEMQSENEVVNTCYATFISLGCTPECACAIIGNIQQESGLKPTAVNPKSGATGLCQWLYDRLTGLYNYAKSKGKPYSDVVTQCEWAIEEVKGKDPTTKSFLAQKEGLTPEEFMQLTDIPRAVDAWRKCFERCGEHEANDAKRLQYAQNWYSQIQQKTDSGTILPPGLDDDDLEAASLEPMLFSRNTRSTSIAYVGDSLTEGLGNTVSGIKTYATRGHTVTQGYKAYADKIVKDKPSIIVMSYGTNDAAGGDKTTTFVNDFKKFIQKLKDGIPNVKIYINTIFPGNASKPNCTSGYKTAIKNIPFFNAKLSEIASAGATVIDCTSVIDVDKHYSSDGLHLVTAGYKAWYDEMQNQMNGSGEDGGGGEPNTVFGWPLPGYSKVSSKFGPRVPPCPGASDNHQGIDIGDAPKNTPVKAYADGVIHTNKALAGNAGNYIKIDHGN